LAVRVSKRDFRFEATAEQEDCKYKFSGLAWNALKRKNGVGRFTNSGCTETNEYGEGHLASQSFYSLAKTFLIAPQCISAALLYITVFWDSIVGDLGNKSIQINFSGKVRRKRREYRNIPKREGGQSIL
jgi:hypothetical protein